MGECSARRGRSSPPSGRTNPALSFRPQEEPLLRYPVAMTAGCILGTVPAALREGKLGPHAPTIGVHR